MIKHFYIILFFRERKIIPLELLINEILQLNDMVSKILNSNDKLSSTIWFRLNRMKNRSEISTAR